MTADAVGGVWTYALDLAEGLARASVQTTLAVLGPSPHEAQRAAAAAVDGLQLIDTGLPLDWTASSAADVEAAGERLAGLAAVLRPDLVHLNSPALAATGRFAAPVLSACHSCLATWWAAVKREEPVPEDFAWRIELTARGYAASNLLLANSQAFAQATARAYALPVRPLVVRNGRRVLPPVARAADAPEGPFVFTAGRLWDEGKNVSALARAAGGFDVPAIAAGPQEGPNGERVDLVGVTALGRLSEAEVASWLAAQPIFLSTALYEPFGLAVLEAAQAGCALVLSDIPTFRELWDGAAVFVPPEEPRAIADAVRDVAGDPALRSWLAAEAADRSQRYTVEAMVHGMLEAYRVLSPEVLPAASQGAAA